ncbi:hypothetical protein E5672_03655 [Alteromonas portus]|uniref:Phosphate ABC transporter substrate-binding protein n=1 Tax=Alteromonas portus TaxID=2565549 RepID=A0A4U0ZS29_9ALTE|nr:hypothetical protein [Alteromonas portus]TKB05191.1 hypothetical protein E5672_03655 [Alteromonas portus]
MNLFKRFPLILALALFMHGMASAAQAQEKIVVVTNLNNDVQVLDKKGLIDLFMGKYAAFPNGKVATPIDIEMDAELKSQFYKSLVGLPLARVNAYWSRLKFSGRVKPPAVEQTLDDIKLRLEEDESALAYVYESTVTDNMKVVYRFD